MNDTSNSLIVSFRGSPALSDFRQVKLFQDLRTRLPALQEIYAEYLHFVQLQQALTDDETERLQRVLQYGPGRPTHDVAGHQFLVVPRIGTISPWSTKATDIARHCGLDTVIRMERGTRWTFRFADDSALSDSDCPSCAH